MLFSRTKKKRSKNRTEKDLCLTEESLRIYDEQLVRTSQFFGEEGLQCIKNAYVIIAGVGGVGSHCAVSLARSGVGRLRFIDFDQTSLSSLNRHACATRRDVGLPKVSVLKTHIEEIVPHIQVETRAECFQYERAESLILGGDRKPDFVVDCIDNIPTKVDLIAFCRERGIRCVSSGGAGGKADPTKVRIDDLCSTSEDPLSRAIRIRLRKRGITDNCLMCYSTEKEGKGLIGLRPLQEGMVEEYRPLENFRVRVMPVIAPLPAIFGQALASYVLCELAGQPIAGLTASTREATAEMRLTRRNYKQLFDAVKQLYNGQGQLTTVATEEVELSYRETRWLYLDVFKGTCLVTGKQLKPRALQLVPWRCIDGCLRKSIQMKRNVVCLEQKLAREHLKTFPSLLPSSSPALSLKDIWDTDTIERVNTFLEKQELCPAQLCDNQEDDSRYGETSVAGSITPTTT